MANRTIEIAPLAREDWRGIWDYSVENWSADTAADYYNQIADRMEALAADQLTGLPVYGRPRTYKSLIGSHVIYFRLNTNALIVLRILHQAMDVGKNL
ncbi:MAG: type II toxin-antitoxin system RelE/ParE family toxin [Devosia sp.]|uniref:type II toxin-antitoxin system RelE/ParE family toxin n=1 Tax=Devosia sp. TaxID=1871048 RepID=UPI0024C7C077|nr:type II toxin-antitoxin system RelE/ParE family toxin [Devosia sp.]UYN98634.1 MAG: type II toxin-antitoxin system RelE/ParE family toxin [Devosia sp.]